VSSFLIGIVFAKIFPKRITPLSLFTQKILHHQDREPHLLEANDVKKYITHLALHGRVSASTQNQAFNALLFLYRHILHIEMDNLTSVARAKRKGKKIGL